MTTAHVATTHTTFSAARPYKTIFTLALPTVIAMVAQSVVNEIDVVFFAHLPTAAEASNSQAALFPSLILLWAFGGTLSAISVGTQALVARRYAERDFGAAGAILMNAVWISLVGGVGLTALGLAIITPASRVIALNPAVQATIQSYGAIRLCGVISMGMTMGIKAFFDGIGRTRVHLVASVVMNVLNVLLCYTFIFGHFGAPRLGAFGAGLAAFIATWVGLGIMLFYARGVARQFRWFRWSNVSRALSWSILRLSIPAGAATAVMMGGFALFAWVAGRLDTIGDFTAAGSSSTEPIYGAATTDIVEILKLTFTACIGFGTATATLVGQSLGAKKPDDAARYGWASARLGFVLFGLIGLCEGVFFTPQIVHFLTHSQAVYDVALVPMRIMGIATPIIAVAMILSEALFGAGNPRFVAITQLILIFGCLVPGAYLLGIVAGNGLVGVWSAAVVYAIFAAVAMTLKFRQGTWRHIQL
jgi:MATE family multidrug resistance protein